MSVFSKVKSEALSKNVDMEILESSLAEINLSLDHKVKKVENSWGSARVDMGIVCEGKLTSLGFVINDKGGVELEGDPFLSGVKDRLGVEITDGGHQGIMDVISQLYQKNLTLDVMSMNGWTTEVVSNSTDEEIVIECYR